jgi:O-succinylbenzoic acid--CoA ligase
MYPKIIYQTSDKIYINEVNQFIEEWFNDKEFITTKTSGSTGIPKEIRLKKDYLRASARMTGIFFDFKEKDNLLLSLPIYGIGGKMIIIRAIEFKCNLIVVSPQYNPLKEVIGIPIKIVSLVPYQINKIIDETPELFELVENILIGGAPLNSSLIKRINQLPSNNFETFGMTETYSHIALKNLKKENYFRVFQNISITIKQECLQINAPVLGITNLLTNDIIKLIDKDKFKWIGRKDFVINSGGLKLHPELIEQKIETLIPSPYFISKEKNDQFGEIVILVIESTSTNEKTLLSILKKKLTPFEVPKKIYQLEEFVYTPTRKINKIETLKKI